MSTTEAKKVVKKIR